MSTDSASPALTPGPKRQHSLWQSPDNIVDIHLTFTVIDGINEALRTVAAGGPVRGSEIAGLLLGRSERGDSLTVWIDSFEPIPRSYSLGASWVMTASEQDKLKDRLAEHRDTRVVGFFRSHTRKDLFLSEDDVALFSRFFADPTNVFLLVKPFTTRPNRGGFFYWEDGTIHRTESRLEFPFHRGELGGGEPVPVAALPREAWVPVEAPISVPKSGPAKGRQVSMRGMLGYALVFAGLCAAGYAAYARYGGHPPERMLARQTPPSPPGANAQREGTVRLSATEGDRNITLTWDRASPIIAAGTRATLEIAEGSFHKNLELNPEDLRAGHVIYSRPDAISDTVAFRMQVHTGQGEPFREAVQFVTRGKAPAAILAPATHISAPKAPVVAAPAIADLKEAAPKPKPIAAELPMPPAEPLPITPKTEAPKLLRPAPRRDP